MSYDEDPLDLLEDDGDGVIETILFFDEEEKKQQGSRPSQNSGCCVALTLIGSTFASMGYGLFKILT